MPLFRNRKLPPKEKTKVIKTKDDGVDDDWLDETTTKRKKKKTPKKSKVLNSDDEEIEYLNSSQESVPRKVAKKEKSPKKTPAPLNIDQPSTSHDIPSSDTEISTPPPCETLDMEDDQNDIISSPVTSSNNTTVQKSNDEPLNTGDSTNELDSSASDSAFDNSLRIRYNGNIKRITFDKNFSLNSQLNRICEAFKIEHSKDVKFVLIYEKEETRLDMNATPIKFPEKVNFIVDVFRLLIQSKNIIEIENAALAKLGVLSEEEPLPPPKKVDEYDLEDGRFKIKVRITIQAPHNSCSNCISNCNICSQSSPCFDSNKLSKRKDTIFKTKIDSSKSELSNLFSLVMKHFCENYVSGEDKSNDSNWINVIYEFDGESLDSTTNPEDYDMDPESLIDAKFKDSRCDAKQCGCSASGKRPKGPKKGSGFVERPVRRQMQTRRTTPFTISNLLQNPLNVFSQQQSESQEEAQDETQNATQNETHEPPLQFMTVIDLD